MNTRWLFLMSLIIAIFAVWFYRNQGNISSPINLSTTNIAYEASDIAAVQTDEDGSAEYTLIAEKLVHYDNENVDKLHNMTLNWQSSSGSKVMVNADTANWYHESEKVVMNNNVMLVNGEQNTGEDKDAKASGNINAPIQLQTDQLIGDIEAKLIISESPVQVTQGDNTFDAAGARADMRTGEYEFDQVAMTFMPPPRRDVPLF